MTETDDIVARLRAKLGGVQIDAMQGDNLAIILCTAFDDPDEDVGDETCWGASAISGSTATLDAIHAHYASHITRLEERCAAYKGQVEAGAAEIERLNKDLRTVQNAAKTIASCQGTELEHLRQNFAFDHKLRAEVEGLRDANSLLTDQALAAEARADTLQAEVERLREALHAQDDMWKRGILFMSGEEIQRVHDLRRAALQHQEPKP